MLSQSYQQLAISALVLSIGLTACKPKAPQTPGAPPAVPVSVMKAVEESVPVEIHVVGNVEPSETVHIRTQVSGPLLRVHFREGQDIAQGALLFEIDPKPYQEALRQAEGQVTRDRARLQQAEATLQRDLAQAKYSQTDAERNLSLSKEGIIARSTYDQFRSKADVDKEAAAASRAAIDSAKADVQNDLAAVDKAKLDLSYCTIRAPIAGRAGNLLVNAGNLVQANQTELVVINKVSPAFVTFSVPELHLASIRRQQAKRPLPVRVSPKDDATKSAMGRLLVIDNTVDAATGAIRLKAVFENKDRLLWPGQFVSVSLVLDTIAKATIVPGEAVQSGQDTSFVYIVKADNTVEFRPVTPGVSIGDRMVIDKGVDPGETVVTDGQLRLAPGMPIQAVDPAKLNQPGNP